MATQTVADHETREGDDISLIADLRGGSESAFMCLVDRYHASLLRLARLYIDGNAAEDVVQETWMGVLRGLASFQGRASFKTWLFRILANRARTRAGRESRTVALSSLVRQETESYEPAVDPAR